MAISITTGNYSILYSGVFHALEKEESVIDFDDIKLIVIFENAGNNKPSFELSKIDDRTAKIKLIDHNGSLGMGNRELIKLGSIDNGELFLSYRVYTLTNPSLRSFQYTIYKKKND